MVTILLLSFVGGGASTRQVCASVN